MLAVGCGGADQARTTAPGTTAPAPPPARVAPRPKAKPKPHTEKTYVIVIDGDVNRRIQGARVHIGHETAFTKRKGGISFQIRPGSSWNVRFRAPGYAPRALPVTFLKKSVTLRLYRPRSQWPMYGVSAHRTQSQTSIRLRPPFKVIWSRGMGSMLEFPAVVSDGIAYVTNYRGQVYALSMRYGHVVWRADTGAKMAASPAVAGDELVVHGMDGVVRVFDRRNGKLEWHYTVGAPVESSPITRGRVDYFGSWNGRIYAL